MSSQNKLLNAWISNNTNLTGGVSLRNEGKTYLTQELKTAGGVDCTASQNIDFGNNIPKSSGLPSASNDLINKAYGDANYHPSGGVYMDLSSNQTVAAGAVKTFSTAPVMNGLSIPSGYRILAPSSTGNLYFSNSNLTNWNSTATYNTVFGGANSGNSLNGSSCRYNSVFGADALRSSSTNQNTAIGFQSLRDMNSTSTGNSAVGAYSGASMLGGCSKNSFFSSACGNGLSANCSSNICMGVDSLSLSFAVPLTYYYYNSVEITANTYTLVLPSTIDKWATHLFVFIGNSPYTTAYKVTCSEANLTTKTLTFETNTWRLGSPTYLVIYERGEKITTNYTGATTTGTTFTIATGLAITAGMRLSYMETTTLNKQATVSTYTSATGILVLTTSIQLLTNQAMNFFNSTRITTGTNINNNVCQGEGSLQNVGANCWQNVCVGSQALNGVNSGLGFDSNRFVYARNNVMMGYRAAYSAWGKIENCVMIGATCDVENAKLNNITNSIAIGYNTKIWKSNQILIGGTTINKSLMISGLIEYDHDTDQVLIFNTNTQIIGELDLWSNNLTHANIDPTCNIDDAALSGNVPLLNAANTFNQVNEFTSIPICTATYTAPTIYALINKEYADANYLSTANIYMDLSSNQTVNGVKTFNQRIQGSISNVYVNGGGAGDLRVVSCSTISADNSIYANSNFTFNPTSNLVKIQNLQVSNTLSLAQGSVSYSSIEKNSTALNNAQICIFAPNSGVSITNAGYTTATYDITLFGAKAGDSLTDAGSTFQAVCAVGAGAYATAQTGQEVVAVGTNAAYGCAESNFSVFMGAFSGGSASHNDSVFIGDSVGNQMTGMRYSSTIVGSSAYYYNTTGDYNTSLGSASSNANVAGNFNVAIGFCAYADETGYVSQDSSNCVFIGARSGNGNNPNIYNSVAIGYNAQVQMSDTIQLGNSSHVVKMQTLAVDGAANITGNLTNYGTFTPSNINMNSTTQINSIYRPYLVAPTITSSQNLPNPIPGVLFVNNTTSPAADIYITLPLITANMIGIQIRCKRFGNNNNVRINCASGNTAIGQTSLGSVSQNGQTLIPTSAYNGTLICISMTQWACYS